MSDSFFQTGRSIKFSPFFYSGSILIITDDFEEKGNSKRRIKLRIISIRINLLNVITSSYSL
ncbi:hypothetical protein MYP_3870 [Sporocytophaga myxococcoides]|uniref:Uncharacterized protein n=1 Tax=Sporocytophaga myxococcoides TaxID=153721 RepID=A0A098LI46_9BACT|nr:hypothetical protein MYP_3870 [Sporocytophaga myxococcoides]